LILEDNGSKFGTMIKINKAHKILSIKDNDGNEFNNNYKYNASIYQIGRTMIYFKLYN
jgi:hypothetical protein